MFRVLEPAKLGPLELRNRFIRSATWDSTAEDNGAVTDHSVRIYQELAAGGVGLIITGFAYVSPLGKAGAGQYGIYSDEMIPSMKRLANAAHEHDAKIAIQIHHAGGNSPFLRSTGQVALAPSKIEARRPHRAMTDEEVEGIIEDFVAAAVRTREAGFDAVQFHGAHGYLMSQFFSTITNHREDRWGGSPENRRRFHLEVIRRTRAAVGADFPILIKFGIMDDSEGGTGLEEGIEALKAMAEAGLDGVEISGGIGTGTQSSTRVTNDDVLEDVFYRERAAAARNAVSIPVAMVGGIRYLETAEEIITAGEADFISLSRPLIREPELIRRWAEGDRQRAKCITCNKCFAIAHRGEPLDCGEERLLREAKTVNID